MSEEIGFSEELDVVELERRLEYGGWGGSVSADGNGVGGEAHYNEGPHSVGAGGGMSWHGDPHAEVSYENKGW